MRWPIKNQILVPFVGIVIVSVTAIAVGAAMLAAERSEQQTMDRLRTVVSALDHTNIPFTEPVLQKMRELSGAHFVARTAGGKSVASTFPEDTQLPDPIDTYAFQGDLDSLARHPMLTVGATRYFASMLPTPGNSVVSSLLVLYPEQDWSRARRDAAILPLAVGVATVLLTAIAALWVAHRFSGRIRSLQEQVASIAAGSFIEIPVSDRSDEVQELVISVNRMCVQLRQMKQVIRESERSRLLGQFAGGLAHQLRNAITGARLSLQIHQRRCATLAGDQTLDVALGQLSLTETHVKGLLSLGRNEQRRLLSCDIRQLIQEISALLEPVCLHAQVSLDVSRVEPELSVRADIESLRAALMNVLLNGIEAAGRGGDVDVAASKNGGNVCIDVRDTGKGPPAGLEESLFEPFVTGKAEGIGLGLSIARQVALDLGGTLSWHRDGNRTCFRILLPLESRVMESAEGSREDNADLLEREAAILAASGAQSTSR